MLSDIGQKAEIQEIVLKLDKLHKIGWYLIFAVSGKWVRAKIKLHMF